MSKNAQQLIRRPNDPLLLLLTSLASGPKHGYALSKDVEEFAGVTLSPGTLYGAITRLEELGLTEPLEEVERRRPYRITSSGTSALREITIEMRRLADVGTQRLRLAPGGAT